MAVIYDYYYYTVMADAIAWLPHIEILFSQERKRAEHRVTLGNLPSPALLSLLLLLHHLPPPPPPPAAFEVIHNSTRAASLHSLAIIYARFPRVSRA